MVPNRMVPKKSSHHSKITGDFSERLMLYWLSKYGFECAYVDHVGLDIIAKNPLTDELMGISVKSRSRNAGTEGTSVNISKDNLPKLDAGCRTFGCQPYFAVVVDEGNTILAFIISVAHLLTIMPPGKRYISWNMSEARLQKYKSDPEIKWFEFTSKTGHWWP
jgi:hypothetical protein